MSSMVKVIQAESGLRLRQWAARALCLPTFPAVLGIPLKGGGRGDTLWAVYKDSNRSERSAFHPHLI